MNTVIDPPDLLRNIDNDMALEEDLSVNEIESIAELVLEHGMDMENAVPESDDSDTENLLKKYEVVSFFQNNILDFAPIDFSMSIEHNSVVLHYFSAFSLSLDSPPPQV